MKPTHFTPLLMIMAIAFAVFLADCGGSEDSSGDDENTNGYIPMEDPPQYKLSYLGGDYDALCVQAHGEGFISFLVEDEDSYLCLETCSKNGKQRGICEAVENVHYGLIDITTIETCTKVDGKKVYIKTEYQHCNHACTEDGTACD